MNFEQWLTANGYDAATLSATQKKHLEAAWKADTKPEVKPEPKEETVQNSGFEEKMEAIQRENDRITYIREATVSACEKNLGNLDKVKQLRELAASAIADKKMDVRAFQLALLRADRMLNVSYPTHTASQVNESVIEAAICINHKLPDVEKHFSEQTLQAAHTRFKRGIGLNELLLIAAERNNGYRGSSRDYNAVCRAAFSTQHDHYGMSAEGPSTIAVPGILSNIANKFLATSFLYSEQSWRGVASIRSASDFKTMTTYRLDGDLKFVKVPAGGEIKHGTLSELTYTNKVDTYGKMLGIDRRDIMNDDLGAFASATKILGRGAGDALNDIFWTAWLDDSAFFPTDKSYNNYDDGAVDSVLGLAGLANADTIFRSQTKADGTPIGIMPTVLLVPVALRTTAMTLMQSTINVSGSTTLTPNANIFAQAYRVVSSIYLSQSTIAGASVNGSSTAWYLLADPNNIAAIEVAFLNGAENPTVETGEFEFDRLGLSMRAYMDMGVSKQEHKAAVKMKGAA